MTGNGNCPPARKAGFLAADSDQIRLGKNLQQVVVLQRADRRANVKVRAEHEQVQQIAHADLRSLNLRYAKRIVLELQLVRGADRSTPASSASLEVWDSCSAD